MASVIVFGVGEPAAARVIRFAVGTNAGLRPDCFCTERFGEFDGARKFGERAVGVDEVSVFRWTADALVDELIVAPFVEEIILGGRTAFDIDDESSTNEGLGYIFAGPIDDQDGAGVLQDLGGVHG